MIIFSICGDAYGNLEACPACGALWYKINRDDPSDVEEEPPRRGVPTKLMWYFPIIPRLNHLFRNKTDAKSMGWQKQEGEILGMN